MSRVTTACAFTLVSALTGAPAPAQSQTGLSPQELQRDTTAGAQLSQGRGLVSAPVIDVATSVDWPLNNFDEANARFVPLTEITSANVNTLVVRWLHHTQNSRATPIVAGGLMYVTTPRAIVALDATTGRVVWRNTEVSSNRGAVFGAGTIYVANDVRVWALDAKTGEPVPEFGDRGISHVLTDVLRARYADLSDPTQWGYRFNMAPQYFDGVVVVGTALSESHIPGGVVLGVDAPSGELLWQFFGVPQGPEDAGWEIAKNTWVGGVRHGGGLWTTPAIDVASETVHLTIANPSPDQDGSARKGINLFTNAFVTLDLRTGELLWYFQQVHHDLWDYDAGQQPTLFDIVVDGQPIRATAAGNKNGLLFILNSETGEPINPIVETPVPTASETPGEEAWPTQPIPHTQAGEPMASLAALFPRVQLYEQFASYERVPFYTPPTLGGAIHAPREGVHYGGNAFSPDTGWLYVAGRDFPIFLTAIPVGDTLRAGQFSTAGRRQSAAPALGNVSAYDPLTGELVWRTSIPGGPSAGVLATAGDLVFTGDTDGLFYAFDATTGELLWQFDTGAGIRGQQITYQVNGVQYITVPTAGGVIITFALPGS